MTAASGRVQVSPFRALRYVLERGASIERLIAPPYDVISASERQRLAGDPHNIVWLDLPGDAGGAGPYREAAGRLREWTDSGVLTRDPRPAFYRLRQEYAAGGGTRLRSGLFARLGLEPFEAGVVIPHERTLERPRRDRQQLLEATRTHLSPIFVLHPDPGGQIARLLVSEIHDRPLVKARDAEGTLIELTRIDDPAGMQSLTRLLDLPWVLIADGHHRYESALAYRDARRAAGARDAEHVLVFLCSLEDEGLSISPIHRLVHSVPGFEAQRVRTALSTYFDLTPIAALASLPERVREGVRSPGVFGLVFGEGGGSWVARWRPGAGLELPALRAVPEALRSLDVILFHRLVLEEVLRIDAEAQARQTHIEYIKDEAQFLERSGGCQLGVLLNPTRIEQVVEVSRAGLRLPQKTTYFYPKVPSGLVLDPLDD